MDLKTLMAHVVEAWPKLEAETEHLYFDLEQGELTWTFTSHAAREFCRNIQAVGAPPGRCNWEGPARDSDAPNSTRFYFRTEEKCVICERSWKHHGIYPPFDRKCLFDNGIFTPAGRW